MKQLLMISVLISILGTLSCSQEPPIIELQNALVVAIQNGDLSAVEENLALGATLDEPNFRGKVPLLVAIKGGDIDIIKKLLEEEVQFLDFTDGYGTTALHKAVQCDNVEVVESLLKGDADRLLPDRSGSIPLHTACKRQKAEIIEQLLKKGSEGQLCSQDNEGNTPVHYLVLSSSDLLPCVLPQAVECDAMKQVNRQGCIPLLSAVTCSVSFDMVQLLLAATPVACIDAQDKNGNTVLHRLIDAMNINESIAGSFEGMSAKEYMASREYPKLLKLILSAGVNPAIKNQDQLTASQMAKGPLTKAIIDPFFSK